jgi:hypothetical protein
LPAEALIPGAFAAVHRASINCVNLGLDAYQADWPPSTGVASAINKVAPGLTRQSTVSAISSGVPKRPIGGFDHVTSGDVPV